ncbi:MAG: dinitrogenase iron-molybdenum cofactor biosynthesis protein [Clostridia bacterium]|nr:dinitrogenase iron-molybdenum cofactor biosynthesis protein [Clostridia bacterium]
MKIAIPVDVNSIDTTVCISFGRAPYFMIFDTEKGNSVFLDNSAAASSGGAGIKAAQLVVDNGAEVLITPRCGENAAAVLFAANIKLYKSTDAVAKANIDLYLISKLPILNEIHAGFHNHGNN